MFFFLFFSCAAVGFEGSRRPAFLSERVMLLFPPSTCGNFLVHTPEPELELSSFPSLSLN